MTSRHKNKNGKSPKENLLVTGAAGYIGSVLIEKLVALGYTVNAADTLYFGIKPLRHLRKLITLYQDDVRTIPRAAFQNVATIIHLAGLSNDPTAEFNPKANKEINTTASIRLARRAKKYGVKRFIFASSCSIYDMGFQKGTILRTEKSRVKPTAAYSSSKFHAEKGLFNLADKSFTVTALRKGTVSGFSRRMRYDLVINAMIKDAVSTGKIHVFSNGEQWRPIIDIQDVADAYIAMLSQPAAKINKQIFNISLGNYQIIDLAKIVEKTLRDRFRIKSSVIVINEEKNGRSYQVSNEKAKQILNFSPKVSVEQSVAATYEGIIAHGFLNFSSPRYYNIKWMKKILENL